MVLSYRNTEDDIGANFSMASSFPPIPHSSMGQQDHRSLGAKAYQP